MILFYAHVSTTEQTTAHQHTLAEQAGFKIDKVVADEGVSGVSTRLAERPEGKRLFDMLRTGDTLVVRWLDRLGRNYTDVVDTIREFMRRGVIIKTVINGMTFGGSTTDPMQQAVRDALIAFMAATAQAQAEATKSAQRAGIDHSRRAKPSAYLGRKPSYDRTTFDRIRLALDSASPPSLSAIAKAEGLSKQAVFRLKQDPQAALAALDAWGLQRLLDQSRVTLVEMSLMLSIPYPEFS
jgi:putative DNA-invertase from lambdoid prophage Rac